MPRKTSRPISRTTTEKTCAGRWTPRCSSRPRRWRCAPGGKCAGTAVRHTCRAIEELGKAAKSIFVAEDVAAPELRREIHDGPQIVENWNSANTDPFYGRAGTPRQRPSTPPGRSLSPLFWPNATLYGRTDIAMDRRLGLAA
ncbi:Tn3 family transposase [Nonomuraea sp. NPDC050663]|uniref:Tn3 family transposase n=1 Tax=Nonomuraea sp. NPDC050663 TaxID=3364370 RepID=UPI0037A11584